MYYGQAKQAEKAGNCQKNPLKTAKSTLKTANSQSGGCYSARISGDRPLAFKYTDPDGNVDIPIFELYGLYAETKNKPKKNEIDEYIVGIGDGILSNFFIYLNEKLNAVNKKLDNEYNNSEGNLEKGNTSTEHGENAAEKTEEPKTNGEVIIDKLDKINEKLEAFLEWNNKPNEE